MLHPFCNRENRALPEHCGDSLHLLHAAVLAATMAFLLPVPEMITVMQRSFKDGLYG